MKDARRGTTINWIGYAYRFIVGKSATPFYYIVVLILYCSIDSAYDYYTLAYSCCKRKKKKQKFFVASHALLSSVFICVEFHDWIIATSL